MIKDEHAIIYAYIGQAGSGKTYKALKDLGQFKRQIRIDPQIYGQADIQEGCEVFKDVRTLSAFVKSQGANDFKACICPKGMSLEEVFHWVCSIALVNRNIAIFADEANRYINRHSLSEAAQAVFFQSRHTRTRLLYTMFNPKTVSPEMRLNTTKVHLFRSFESNFTNYLKEAGATDEMIDRYLSENLPSYSYALVENGKRPEIKTPNVRKVAPSKPKPKPPNVAKKGTK